MKKSKAPRGTHHDEPLPDSGPNGFLIAGIGASAGGIEALQAFFGHVPAEGTAAYVVILHPSPGQDRQLAPVLQAATPLPVMQVTEKVAVMSGHVYVVPPDRHLVMEGDTIAVLPDRQPEDRRALIDILFRTLADSYGPRAVCVVLSGTGADGAMGLKRVKERGGAAFVQNPREAAFNEMPRNAIATGLVDAVLDVAEIPARIHAYEADLRTTRIRIGAENRGGPDQQALRETGEHDRGQPEEDVRQRTAELKQAQEFLQGTLDSSLYVIQAFQAVRDADGTIVDFTWLFNNKAAQDQNGDVIGKSLLEHSPGVVETGLFRRFVNVTETGVTYDGEQYYNHEQFDGWFHQIVVKMGDGFVMSTEDITPRKRAEGELQATKSLLQATMDSALDMIQVFEAVRDDAGAIVDFRWILNNHAAEKQYGNVIGQRLLECNPGVVAEGIFETFKKVTETGIPDQSERHYVHEQFDGWFYQSTVKLGDGVATSTVDVSSLKEAEREVLRLKEELAQQATDKYQNLFNSVDDGFAILELIRDETGNLVDFCYLETNPAFVRHVGTDLRGKKRSELGLDQGDFVLEQYRRLVRTGEPVHFEYRVHQLGDQWFQVTASLVGGPGSHLVGVIFRNITGRKERERQQEFLLTFSDDLRTLGDATAIEETGVRMLADHLRLDRAYVFVLHPAEDRAVVRSEHRAAPFASIAGDVRMSDFPETVVRIEDETLVVNDTDSDARFSVLNRASLHAMNLQAFVCASVRNGEKTVVWSLAAASATPRTWTKGEVELIEIVAEGIWATAERANAEAALRESEEQFRRSIEDAPIPVIMHAEDGEVLQVSRSWTELTGYTLEDTTIIQTWLTRAYGVGGEDVRDAMQRSFAPQAGQPMRAAVFNIITKQGERRTWSFSASTPGTLRDGRRFAVGMAEDITERMERERKQQFLLRLSDRLRPLSDADEIEATACRVLGEWLGAHRVYYVEICDSEGTAKVRKQYLRDDATSIAGDYTIAAFDWTAPPLRRGEAVVVSDIHHSDLVPPAYIAAMEEVQQTSVMLVPLVKDGGWVGALTAGDNAPRDWKTEDVALARETLEQMWAAAVRARAEEALRESERRLQSITDLVPDLLWASEPDGSTSWYNQRWLEYTGQRLEEAIGWGWMNAIHPDDRAASARRYREAAEKGAPLRQEHRIRRHDGAYRWFVVNMHPVQDEHGRVEKMYGAATDIHESRLTTEALRASEDRLRTLSDAVPQVIWTNDSAGTANYFNQRWYEYTGLTYRESHGLSWQAIVHPDDAPASNERWEQALAAGTVFDAEFRLRRADGAYRWFITRNVPLKGADGKPGGWFGSATDIHDLKLAEEALHVSRERLRITMESATDYAIITTDVDGRIQAWSKGAELAFGYCEQEAVGQSTALIFTPEDRAAGVPQQELGKARDEGRAEDERWHLRRDGSRFYMSGVTTPIYDGELSGYVKVARDMTGQKEAEERLRVSEERYRVALQSADMGAWDWDVRADTIRWNDQHFLLLGLEPEDRLLDSAFFLQFIHPDDLAAVSDELTQAVEKTGHYRVDAFRIVRADGQVRWMSGFGRSVTWEAGRSTRMVGVMFDITDRKLLEQEKEQFIGIASHELRTPVTSIKAYAEILQEIFEDNGDAQGAGLMQKLDRQVDRLTALIYALLDTTRVTEGKLQLQQTDVAIDALIADTAETMQHIAGSQRIELELEAGVTVRADAERIRQVLTNLISNAIKYAPGTDRIIVQSSADDRQVTVCVRDFGPGIDEEMQHRVFERFFRGDDTSPASGLGLGLFISAGIVRQHGGTMAVWSRKGDGALLYFTLPLPIE